MNHHNRNRCQKAKGIEIEFLLYHINTNICLLRKQNKNTRKTNPAQNKFINLPPSYTDYNICL